jgi:hypothetical protein
MKHLHAAHQNIPHKSSFFVPYGSYGMNGSFVEPEPIPKNLAYIPTGGHYAVGSDDLKEKPVTLPHDHLKPRELNLTDPLVRFSRTSYGQDETLQYLTSKYKHHLEYHPPARDTEQQIHSLDYSNYLNYRK